MTQLNPWTPAIGEGLRDDLAEHAITLLADWIDMPPVTRCTAVRDERVPSHTENAGGAQRGN